MAQERPAAIDARRIEIVLDRKGPAAGPRITFGSADGQGPGGSIEEATGRQLADLQARFTGRAAGTGMAGRATAFGAIARDRLDTGYWFCVYFQTGERMREFLRKAGWKLGEKYLDGEALARRLGIRLESPSPGPPDYSPHADLAGLAMTLEENRNGEGDKAGNKRRRQSRAGRRPRHEAAR